MGRKAFMMVAGWVKYSIYWHFIVIFYHDEALDAVKNHYIFAFYGFLA